MFITTLSVMTYIKYFTLPHSVSLRVVSALSYLRLDVQSDLFPSLLPIKFVYTFHLSPMPAARPVHFNCLNLITLIIYCAAPHYAALSSLPLHPVHQVRMQSVALMPCYSLHVRHTD